MKRRAILRGTVFGLALMVMVMVNSPGAGQGFRPPKDIVKAQALLDVDRVRQGSTVSVAVTVEIKEGFHVNSNKPTQEGLIATQLTFKPKTGLKLKRIWYPPGQLKKFSFSSEKLSVYEGKLMVGAIFGAAPNFPLGKHVLSGELRYQACTEKQCYPPGTVSLSIPFEVVKPNAPVKRINSAVFSELRKQMSPPKPTKPTKSRGATNRSDKPAPEQDEPQKHFRVLGLPTVVFLDSKGEERKDLRVEGFVPPEDFLNRMRQVTGVAPASAGGDLQQRLGSWVRGLLTGRHFSLALLVIFLSGLALNLTPCVYPMIPITIGYFGAQSEGRRSKPFLLGVFFVLGLAVMYSALGTAAAASGKLLGSALQSPAVKVFLSAVFVSLALSMFGLYEIQPPGFVTSKFRARTGLIGSLLMGLLMGIVAAPCIGPAVAALMAFVASTGNVWVGFVLFFVFSVGLGLPYLFLAIFSSALRTLPRSGAWMVWVKKLFGVLMVGAALYFLQTLLPVVVYQVGWVILLLAAGIYLGWMEKSGNELPRFLVSKRVVGSMASLIAVGVLVQAVNSARTLKPTATDSTVRQQWVAYTPQRLRAAQKAGLPVIIDFTADWCAACKELEHKTFSHPSVKKEAERFVTLKVDLTSGE